MAQRVLSSFALVIILAVSAFSSACGKRGYDLTGLPAVLPEDHPLRPDGSCSNPYIQRRNGLVERANKLGLELRSGPNEERASEPVAQIEKVAELQRDLEAFMTTVYSDSFTRIAYGDVVCRAPVAACGPGTEVPSDVFCKLGTGEIRDISNDELRLLAQDLEVLRQRLASGSAEPSQPARTVLSPTNEIENPGN